MLGGGEDGGDGGGGMVGSGVVGRESDGRGSGWWSVEDSTGEFGREPMDELWAMSHSVRRRYSVSLHQVVLGRALVAFLAQLRSSSILILGAICGQSL